MRWGGSRGILMLLLFLLAGALIGGLLGDLLAQVSLAGIMPYLVKQYVLIDVSNIRLNLYILTLDFGIRFAPNLLSIIGIFIAAWLFRRW